MAPPGRPSAGRPAKNKLNSSGSQQRHISDIIQKFNNSKSTRSGRSPSKRPRARSGSEPPDPAAPDLDLGSEPAGGVRAGPSDLAVSQEDSELVELIRVVMRSELDKVVSTLQKDFEGLQKSFRDSLDALSERIRDMEGRIFEKDQQIDSLSAELENRGKLVESLEDKIDDMEADLRLPVLIISGPAVPAPPPPPAPGARRSAAGDQQPWTPEDAASVAVAVIRKSLPAINIERSDIASCFRVGKSKTLVCRFVRHGPGSVRDSVYQGRFELMRHESQSGQLFISESLSQRRQAYMTTLLNAKKRKEIYTVFSRNGVVFYKEQKEGPAIRVYDAGKISRFT